MRFLIPTLACLVLSTQAASAIQITTGKYDSNEQDTIWNYPNYPTYVSEGSVKLTHAGNVITVDDFKNGIVYTIDTANPGEQTINPLIIEKLRHMAGSRVIGRMIEKMTISEVKETIANKLTAKINVYLSTKSPYLPTPITAKFQIGVQVDSSVCPIKIVNFQKTRTASLKRLSLRITAKSLA